MATTLILTGDVNLLNVTDPTVPLARGCEAPTEAALVFGNLECRAYAPPSGHSFHNVDFFADPGPAGEPLQLAASKAVGVANDVSHGEAAILASIARLEVTGGKIAGAGFHFVCYDAKNQTVPRYVAEEGDVLTDIVAAAARLATALHPGAAWVKVPVAP